MGRRRPTPRTWRLYIFFSLNSSPARFCAGVPLVHNYCNARSVATFSRMASVACRRSGQKRSSSPIRSPCPPTRFFSPVGQWTFHAQCLVGVLCYTAANLFRFLGLFGHGRSGWGKCSASLLWKTSISTYLAQSIREFWRRWQFRCQPGSAITFNLPWAAIVFPRRELV